MILAEMLLMMGYMERIRDDCPSEHGLYDDECRLLYNSNEAESCRECWEQAINLELKQTHKGEIK